MCRVRWQRAALNELANLWLQADGPLRARIIVATHQVDSALRRDPIGKSESRSGNWRILLVSPLGVAFRIEPDGRTVSVTKVWVFQKRH